MSDPVMIEAGWLSILPPLIAIVLALISKEVYSSLIVGVFSGLLIYNLSSGGTVLDAIVNVPELMGVKIGENSTMILFLALLGALVAVVTIAGGSRAYGDWARKKSKSVQGAKLLTAILGVFIFIDDYFNCLTVGTVMRPVTDKFNISRAKLSYIIDATAAPVCIIAPISSWAVAVAGNIGGENGFSLFVQAIPYNLYALLTIGMIIVLCVTNFDFGPMKRAQEKVDQMQAVEADEGGNDDFEGTKASDKGHVLDLVIPILVLIVLSILGMAYVGGFFSGVDFSTAIGENPTFGLALGAFGALLAAALLYIPRKIISFRDFMEGIAKGIKSMVPAIMILTLAWSLSGICRDLIGTGPFVAQLVSGAGNWLLQLLPAIVFALAAFLSFSMGTAWGTFGILLPIVIPIVEASPENAALLLPTIGATLAGSVYGDHCSPISDTTILSSTGAKCNHMLHVSTQIPYATFVAVICFVGYLVAGLTGNAWLTLIISFALMFAAMFVISLHQKKGKAKA